MNRRNFIGALVAAVVGTAATASDSAGANAWGIETETHVDRDARTVRVEVTNYLDTHITPTVRVSAGGDDTGHVRLPRADPGTGVSETIDVSDLDISEGVTADLSLW